jgi:hypothetical protein
MKKYLSVSAGLLSLFFSSQGLAADLSDLDWFTSLGYEFGGERYGKVIYVGTGITENAYANDGWRVTLGAHFPNNAAKTFETQMAIGIKFGGPNGDKSGIYWNSYPIELIEYYRQGNWRSGLGLASHVNTFVKAQSVNKPTETYRLNPALGYLASVVYTPVTQNYAMEARYTYLKQAFADAPDEKIKASVFGLLLHYRF